MNIKCEFSCQEEDLLRIDVFEEDPHHAGDGSGGCGRAVGSGTISLDKVRASAERCVHVRDLVAPHKSNGIAAADAAANVLLIDSQGLRREHERWVELRRPLGAAAGKVPLASRSRNPLS